VLGGLEFPVDLVELKDGSLLIAGKLGQLSRVDPSTYTILDTFRVDEAISLPTEIEEGLLSLALSPDFGLGAPNHLYTWQTTIHGRQNSLIRWHLNVAPLSLSVPTVVLSIDKWSTGLGTHNGGKLIWWEGESDEPVLYLSVGNGGGQGNLSVGQNLDHPSAGILAMNIDDEGVPYPALNSPFGHELLAAKGLRNPWRMADCGAVLCVADVGESTAEELNLYTGVGNNFGHGDYEGPSGGVHDDPIIWYAHGSDEFNQEDPDHSGTLGESIMVGVRVSGTAYGGLLENFVLYSDLYQGWVRGSYISDQGEHLGPDIHLAHQPVLGAMLEVEDGTVYAVDMMGSLRKLVEENEIPTVGEVGEALSETVYAEGGLDYTVRYPLWSNATEKERFIQLPEGSQIDTSDPDHWIYPVGTRAYKTFAWNDQPVETRLLEKTSEGWAAGVYLWEADGSEAWLTDGTEVEPLVEMSVPYTVPSVTACASCHVTAPDKLLGPEPFQLGSQGLELFEPYLSRPVSVPVVVDSDLGVEARGYLHGNCAFCHQGASVTGVDLDLRYSNPPSAIDGEGIYYYSGIPFLDPGSPPNSAIFKAIAEKVMPPIALSVTDQSALDTLSAWIIELGERE
jgi:hypothetical protein